MRSLISMVKESKNILLVEDHADTAHALSRLLKLSGYRVGTATGVESALQLCRSERFDLLISDIGLPDGSGYQIMQEFSRRFGTKGIAVTGFDGEHDLSASRSAGFD